jgi:site-specific DNA-adenine methylase
MKYPTIAYPGGKARLAKTIISMMPTSGRMYVEPFVGRGNVFWAAASVLNYGQWWINDISTSQFYHAIKSHGASLVVPERSREEYYKQWEAFKAGDPQAVLLEPYLTFGGGGYGSGGFGGKKGATVHGYQTTIATCNALLNKTDTRITSMDWRSMGLENLGEQDFVYLDPPYLSADVRAYKDSTIDFNLLVKTLQQAKFKWILSEFKSDLYLGSFGEPAYTQDVQLVGTNFNYDCNNNGQERRVECLWKNY